MDSATPSAKLGRPRARLSKRRAVDPPEEILLAAAKLFTTDGYGSTSTRKIAEAAGLQQASLFYYFPRKEDMFAELLDRTVDPALDFARRLREVDADVPAGPRLYLLTTNDLRNLCRPPGNLGLLQLQREAHLPRFRRFWRKRAALADEYAAILEAGIESEEFSIPDPTLIVPTLFGLIESVCTWFDPKQNDLVDVQTTIGSVVLRAVLPREELVSGVVEEARGLIVELGP